MFDTAALLLLTRLLGFNIGIYEYKYTILTLWDTVKGKTRFRGCTHIVSPLRRVYERKLGIDPQGQYDGLRL